MRRNYERIALSVIAVFTILIMGTAVYFEKKLSDQKAMYYQLQALRTSVNLYKAINKKNPESLNVLIDEEYQFPDEDLPRRYLTNPTVNGRGEIVDPFGRPYLYSPVTGWVRSSTPGYEYW